MGANLNFVRGQGLGDTTVASCEYEFPALMFQPRVLLVAVILAILVESGWVFIVLGALLWWNVLLPRLNPFDAVYDHFVLKRIGHAPIGPARPPRRFSQGLAGSLMLAIGFAMNFNQPQLAWALQILLLLVISLLVFGRFCVGSYIYYHLIGKRAFVNQTMPWSHGK